jgi:hypothetical protein
VPHGPKRIIGVVVVEEAHASLAVENRIAEIRFKTRRIRNLKSLAVAKFFFYMLDRSRHFSRDDDGQM